MAERAGSCLSSANQDELPDYYWLGEIVLLHLDFIIILTCYISLGMSFSTRYYYFFSLSRKALI